MRLLVFQHIPVEHPGIFRDFLAADGHDWQAVELDAGEIIPDLDDFDMLWVMGGPMDTWQEDAYPGWLTKSGRSAKPCASAGCRFSAFAWVRSFWPMPWAAMLPPWRRPRSGSWMWP